MQFIIGSTLLVAALIISCGADQQANTTSTPLPELSCPTTRQDVEARLTIDCVESLVDVDVIVPALEPTFMHVGFELESDFSNKVSVLYASPDESEFLRLTISIERIVGSLDHTSERVPGTELEVFFPNGGDASDAYWIVGDQAYELYWSEAVNDGRSLALEIAALTIQ